MDKRFKMTYLLDIYGGLLTAKQQSILGMHYNDDLTLTEIAAGENVSRQAAFDLVRRAEKLLLSYDEKLNLFEKYLKNCETIAHLEENVSAGNKSAALDLAAKLRDDL